MTEAPVPPALSPESCVHALYALALGRPPDPAGLRHWVAVIEATRDPTRVLAALLDSPERATSRPAVPDAPAAFARAVPPALTEAARAAMTARCRDADAVPKVPGAGLVETLADGTRVQRMHNGLAVLADGYCGPWMTALIEACRGHHEPQEEMVFDRLLAALPADAAMIELGGYWAFYSLWFLHGHPGRRAWVLEPDPAHLEVGRRNAALNRLSPTFVQGFAGGTSAPPIPFATEDSGVLPLPRFGVRELMAAHGLDRLDLLHCDTQGAELEMLRACRPLLEAGRIGTVCVSTHAHSITGDPLTHQRCLAEVVAAGGFLVAEHDVHESFSGDGLIVARFGPDRATVPPVPLSRNRYSESLFRNPLYDLAERGLTG